MAKGNIKTYASKQRPPDKESNDEESDSSISSNDDGNANEKEDKPQEETNEGDHQEHVTSLLGIYLCKLLSVPLEELKARPSAKDAYAKSMAKPIEIIANQFCQLSIDGCNISVRDYPEEKKVTYLKEHLLKFDPSYNNEY
eukprot:12959137-Ditylum_brightwellii.AAC.1